MSTNMYYNIYNRKSDEELKSLLGNSDFTDDTKLIAIKILKERGSSTDEYLKLEKAIGAQRAINFRSGVARDRYRTGFDRFLAMTIDGFVISIISWFLSLPLITNSGIILGIAAIIELALPYAYSILLHGKGGQTLGKMVMNVKIFDKDEKSVITYKQALLRDIVPLSIIMIIQFLSFFGNSTEMGLIYYISTVMGFFLLSWSLLEILTMLFDSKKRALHDYIAGTVVLKVYR